ncbi:unnamed protein product [Parnassius apollo]|uniref:(apollo) hypothetical protein n=1 Tax=Parnassius apollo TaxID=110799 RepID=A0A8S3Y972_PARAO|nr:unnamed protein product [Parnassius apollo]
MFTKETKNALRTSKTKYLTAKKIKQRNTFTTVTKNALRTSKTKYLTTKINTSSDYRLKKNTFILKTNKVTGSTKTQTQRKPHTFSASNPTNATNGNKTDSIEITHSTIALKPTRTSTTITETVGKISIQEIFNITESTKTEYTTETTTGYEVNAMANSSETSSTDVQNVRLVENTPENSTIQVVSQEPSTEPTHKEFSTENVLREIIKTTTKRTRRTLGVSN